MTVAPRRGFLYFARLDKRRPVLVISANARNAGATDVLVIPCSTVLAAAPTHVRLRKGEAGIGATSILKCEQLGVLRKEDLDPSPLGSSLSELRLREVERAVLRAIGVPVPLEN
ncbi:MAG: growth inhibitor [Myxococcales bacterium]|nr:growth inhibitor [Myxococcales bacterium]